MSKKPPTLFESRSYHSILRTVSRITGISPDVIEGPSRIRRHVQARAMLCHRAYQADISYPVIGHLLNRDHTSVRSLAMKYRAGLRKGEPWVHCMESLEATWIDRLEGRA